MYPGRTLCPVTTGMWSNPSTTRCSRISSDYMDDFIFIEMIIKATTHWVISHKIKKEGQKRINQTVRLYNNSKSLSDLWQLIIPLKYLVESKSAKDKIHVIFSLWLIGVSKLVVVLNDVPPFSLKRPFVVSQQTIVCLPSKVDHHAVSATRDCIISCCWRKRVL